MSTDTVSYKRQQPEPAERSRLRLRDLAGEASAGLLQRPGRSVLTMLGTVLGIACFVTILGLTSTASGQIAASFNTLSATEVTVTDAATDELQPVSFPTDADARIVALNGAVAAGIQWPITKLPAGGIAATPSTSESNGSTSTGISLVAAGPGVFAVDHPTLSAGRLYDAFAEQHAEHVAVLGKDAASSLGITRLDSLPAVFVGTTAYTVIGVINGEQRDPTLLSSVLIPTSTATADYGPPVTVTRPTMLIETKLGAAHLIASQAPVALRPDNPQLFQVSAPADPTTLRDQVSGQLNTLFLLLAGISLIIGAFGIANTTLVAVIERTPEIGLRRTLGARRRHIVAQFLTESTVLGTLGGLIGTSLGVAAVLGVAVAHQWTAILQPWTVLPAPLLGTGIGLLAGLYPALRAAATEPAATLRR